MQARIETNGPELGSLYDWLCRTPGLSVRMDGDSTSVEKMGGTADIVVQLAATAGGAGALWAALAKSLSVWLTQRRSDVTVTVTGPDKRKVTVSAHRVGDVESLLRTVLDR
jgi:hypothetical protein